MAVVLETKVDIYFDGACRNVPGSTSEPFGCGVAVFIDGQLSNAFSKYFSGEEGTSNISEWYGCWKAMCIANEMVELLVELGESFDISIYSDSQLIIRQFNGEYQIKEERFLHYFKLAKEESKKFNKFLQIIWIPREKNKEADRLSKIGHQEALLKQKQSVM
jgi:ribonuclease HI